MTHDDNDDETELQLVYADLERLRQSYAKLLSPARDAMNLLELLSYNGLLYRNDHYKVKSALQTAIRKAEARQ